LMLTVKRILNWKNVRLGYNAAKSTIHQQIIKLGL
jgi:hypothetical protein